MPAVQFNAPSLPSHTIGSIRISGERIKGDGSPVFPCLNVPLEMTLNSAELMYRINGAKEPDDEIQDYTLYQISGSLFFSSSQGGGIGEIAHFQSSPMTYFSRPGSGTAFPLRIPLDNHRFQQIEERRIGDVLLAFNFTLMLMKHEPTRRRLSFSRFEKFETCFTDLSVSIAQSDWIKNVLPNLGYGKRRLIEIPDSENAIREGLPRAISELDLAQMKMYHGDYNQVLGKCRNALEILSNARKYEGEKKSPSFADKIDFLLKILPGAPTGIRSENLARMLKDIYGFTSIAQHPSPPHFTRDDAELVLTTTTTLLSYIGKFLSHEEATQ